MSISSVNPPPIPPCSWSQSALNTRELRPAFLPYVYGQVLVGGQGAIGYLNEKDQFVLHLKAEKKDREHCWALEGVEEVWLVFNPTFGMKGQGRG